MDSSPDSEQYGLSHRAHRQLIGYLGLLLPVILLALDRMRPTIELTPWRPLGSISAYYYTGAVAALVGVLFALALFLLTYGGSHPHPADRAAGLLAGSAALGVAFFPTGAPTGMAGPSWWSPSTRTIHYVSAAVLFVMFIVFALWLFPKSRIPEGAALPSGKKWRNRVYVSCGLAMVLSVVWTGTAVYTHRPILLPEAIALWGFAISWLVKGYAHRTVINAVGRPFGFQMKPAAGDQ